MIIIGLDPGIARTGFGVLNTDADHLFVACGIISTQKHQPLSHRLNKLGEDLVQLINLHRPDQAVIEDIFFGANTKTAMQTAQARGVILFLLSQHQVSCSSLTPLQIKSQLCGYGNAPKEQIQTIIKQRLRLNQEPQPDDAADGLAAALCAIDKTYISSSMLQSSI